MSIEDAVLAIPTCSKCGRLLEPCECDSDQARREKLEQFRKAMARELERAGYTVTPPGPEKLRTIPPIDLKASDSAL